MRVSSELREELLAAGFSAEEIEDYESVEECAPAMATNGYYGTKFKLEITPERHRRLREMGFSTEQIDGMRKVDPN